MLRWVIIVTQDYRETTYVVLCTATGDVPRPACRRFFERPTMAAFSPARQSGLLLTPNSSSWSVAATFTPSTSTLHLQMDCGRQNRKLRLAWLRWMSGQRPPVALERGNAVISEHIDSRLACRNRLLTLSDFIV